MMLLAATAWIATLQQERPARPDAAGYQSETILALYDERPSAPITSSPDFNGSPGANVSIARIGTFAWKVEPAQLNRIVCKLYTTDCTWNYIKNVRETAYREYHTVRLDMKYWVDMDGTLLRSESHVRDHETGVFDRRVRVVADYNHKRGSVRVHRVRNGVREPPIDHWPNAQPMDRFRGLLDPMIVDGVLQSKERGGLMVHPITGTLYPFEVKVAGRFSGPYFHVPQEGFYIRSKGADGESTSYVSRQGQLLVVEIGRRYDAALELGYMEPVWRHWGKSESLEWDQPASHTNPERPRFKTMVVPIHVGPPNLLVAYPILVAL